MRESCGHRLSLRLFVENKHFAGAGEVLYSDGIHSILDRRPGRHNLSTRIAPKLLNGIAHCRTNSGEGRHRSCMSQVVNHRPSEYQSSAMRAYPTFAVTQTSVPSIITSSRRRELHLGVVAIRHDQFQVFVRTDELSNFRAESVSCVSQVGKVSDSIRQKGCLAESPTTGMD